MFDLLLDNLKICYEKMVDDVLEELKRILKEEAPKDEDGESTFEDVHGKLFCAKGGTFMVRIKPTDESPPEADLYFGGSIPERTVNNHIYV